MTYGQVWWPILRICALQLTHPKCTHTPWTHTHTHTHTVNSRQQFILQHSGSSWGFGALLKGTSVVVLRVERALDIHSPQLQFLPARDSNPQPFDYKSDSLAIRPRLPHGVVTSTWTLLHKQHDIVSECVHREKKGVETIFNQKFVVNFTDH